MGLRGGGRGGSGGGCTGVGIGHLEVHLLPDCIERIGALVVHDDGIAGLIFRSSRGGVLAPAHEGIAGAGEVQGSVIVVLQLDGFVVQVILRRDSSGAAVGIVGQGRECGLVAPDGVEGDVGDMDGNLVAGLIDGAAVFLGTPTQEHLALGGSQVGSGHDIRVGTVGIGLGVRGRGADAAVGVISDFEGLVAGVVGIEGNIAENPGVKVKGDVVALFVLGSPTAPGVASGHFCFGLVGRQRGFVDGRTVGDLDGSRINSIHSQVRSTGNGRRGPLGVDGDILGRHSAGEDIGVALAQLIVIPALELVLRRNTRRKGGLVRHIGDVCLILPCKRLFYGTVVNKLNLVAVTVIVETDRIAIVAITFEIGTVRQIVGICKAGNRIVILF